MLYELRDYEVFPGRAQAIVDRFANITLNYFKKHGIKPVVFLEPVIGVSNHLVYLVEWESLEQRERCWTAFQSDPGWIEDRTETEKNGPILTRFSNTIFQEQPKIMARMKELGF